MNVVFLDYDGVVNTPMWNADGTHCRFNYPADNKVNNFQCVQWVSEFCEKFGYEIVVTSTWRFDDNYVDCLRNGGLRKYINVIGRTPHIPDGTRGDEINEYLVQHPEVERFVIFDDDNDMGSLENHLIRCNSYTGFGMDEFYAAKTIHESMS